MLFQTVSEISKIFSKPEERPYGNGSRTLAEICGYSSDDKLLIVNADDYGLCSSTNRAVIELIDAGIVSSVSMFASADGTDEGLEVLRQRGFSTGVHLALTSEWENHILAPVLPAEKVPSLLNSSGQFYSEIEQLYLSAHNDEIEGECRAQIESLRESGLKIDHLDTHMGAMQLRPDFIDIYLNLAAEYDLPVRMGSENLAGLMGLPAEQLRKARLDGLTFPDNLVYIPMSFTSEKEVRFQAYEYALRNMPAGITEIYFHPSHNGNDFRALQHEYSKRKDISYEAIRLWDYEFLSEGRLSRILKDEDIIIISYNQLWNAYKALLEVRDYIDN
ncbi:MAG: ChbG/HpnK family deacetylase [candidate division Zixibacteria bacterium]|nr:ChbG/HpnK family deacetylase [candidate division Zixibacteria bacterium]NIR67346.1 ChbG/HpnK family deacetylase [candidate division Zixibacteria bacterium]NIS16223.1 ChbG/HpnK family deacetylase [candidate division Zixibacteria bacterium]NIS48722.1 ChbG/HpnK family deacetylase [candidate division Zixibacteria bacterium]NIT52615.1 ChbG/HpnK family deacetylase [candidate division Zixibacteria bacterium]